MMISDAVVTVSASVSHASFSRQLYVSQGFQAAARFDLRAAQEQPPAKKPKIADEEGSEPEDGEWPHATSL